MLEVLLNIHHQRGRPGFHSQAGGPSTHAGNQTEHQLCKCSLSTVYQDERIHLQWWLQIGYEGSRLPSREKTLLVGVVVKEKAESCIIILTGNYVRLVTCVVTLWPHSPKRLIHA